MNNQRTAYGEALLKLGSERNDIVVLDADLGKSTMGALFGEKYPERYFDVGIAEANMISVAAGLSLGGKTPFAASFAVFATGRPYDQIRTSVCLPSLNVKIIGSSCGLSDAGDGSTHQSIDDIALMRVLPNMTVISPCDANECYAAVMAAASWNGPCYLRICRGDMPCITQKNAAFSSPQILTEGGDAVIFATGIMVSKALAAAQILGSKGIAVRVVNISIIKPLDKKSIAGFASDCKIILTAEEHSIIGGMGSAVLEALAGIAHAPVFCIGIQDRFGVSAHSHDELLEHYRLNTQIIVDTICKNI